jgi:hypothetical protein
VTLPTFQPGVYSRLLLSAVLLTTCNLSAAESWGQKVCKLDGFNPSDRDALRAIYNTIYPSDGTNPYADPDLNKDRSSPRYRRQCNYSSNMAAADICSACSTPSGATANNALHGWIVHNITGATPSAWQQKPTIKTCHDATLLVSPTTGRLYYVDPYSRVCISEMEVAPSGRIRVKGGLPWTVRCFSILEDLEFEVLPETVGEFPPPDADDRRRDGLPYPDPFHGQVDCAARRCIDITPNIISLRSLLPIVTPGSTRTGVCEVPASDSGLPVQPVNSFDPNDKVGSVGTAGLRYLSIEEPLRYSIFFENVATATAPAQVVSVSDQLDLSRVDPQTLSLGPISFGSMNLVPPPGVNRYSALVDLRPTRNLLVKVEVQFESLSGVVSWKFMSLDPSTGELTRDPLAGFLPPNKIPPEGDGKVLFTIMPRATLGDGSTIRNRASIKFDTNAPILTPEWINTIDTTKPSSRVLPLASTQPQSSFIVRWQGGDSTSGISTFNILSSDNGGPFVPWITRTTATEGTFTGTPGHTYRFYSIAYDLVANIESVKTNAEASTSIIAAPTCAIDVSSQVTSTRGGFRLNASTQRYVQSVVLRNNGPASIQGPVSLVFDTLSANATLFNKTGVTACGIGTGSSYVNVNIGVHNLLSPGQTATTILEFTNPTNQGIAYNTRVLAGTGNR